MSEEKKEEKQQAQPKEEARKQEAPKEAAPKTEVPKQEAPKAEAPKVDAPRAEEKKKEKAANCAVCNKLIRKKRYYYRNGKFYCTKRCWKTTVKKENKGAPTDAQASETEPKK